MRKDFESILACDGSERDPGCIRHAHGKRGRPAMGRIDHRL
jgi:hypothetical protein